MTCDASLVPARALLFTTHESCFPIHVPFLHSGANKFDEYPKGSESYYGLKERGAKIEVREHEAGTSYGVYRPAEEDTNCWRLGHFLLPFYTMIPSGVLGRQVLVRAWVPLDDEHTMFWSIVKRVAGPRIS